MYEVPKRERESASCCRIVSSVPEGKDFPSLKIIPNLVAIINLSLPILLIAFPTNSSFVKFPPPPAPKD